MATQHNPSTAGGSQKPETPWRNKIILSAVECEVEGVQLKEAPFPFSQHWDEEAERLLGRGQKRSRDEVEADADEDDEEEGQDNNEQQHEDYDGFRINAQDLYFDFQRQVTLYKGPS